VKMTEQVKHFENITYWYLHLHLTNCCFQIFKIKIKNSL
jgi:hypothetical protein